MTTETVQPAAPVNHRDRPAVNTAGRPDAWEIEKIESEHSMDTTTTITEANCIYEGWIKFDGCANYSSPSAKDCLPHHCGLDGFTNEALVWFLVYRLAGKIMRREWRDPIFPSDSPVKFTEVVLKDAVANAASEFKESPPQSIRSYKIWRSEK